MVNIMLGSCKSICCCFLCKHDAEVEKNGDKNWNGKNASITKSNNNATNNNTKTSKHDDVKVICEANLEHILNNQNGSQNSLYRFVSSNESMSISLHESIIEEEEIEDAEVCDSIVYVVDGEQCYSKGTDNDSQSENDASSIRYIDSDSGSGYSSDVTIVNVNSFDASSHPKQKFSQLSKQTTAQISDKQSYLKRQNEDSINTRMNLDLSKVNEVPKLSSTFDFDRDNNSKNAQTSNSVINELRHLTDEKHSANKSTLLQGKFDYFLLKNKSDDTRGTVFHVHKNLISVR